MESIIASIPWSCDFEDGCKQGWHLANYWGGYADGTYSVDWYSDGDHESVDESEIPTCDSVEKAWLEYAKYVLESGEDPLANYPVKRDRLYRQVWYFQFNRSIAGPVLCRAKHAGKEIDASPSSWSNDIPDNVMEYLNLEETILGYRLRDFDTWEEFKKAVPGVSMLEWFRVEVDDKQPRSRDVVQRELRKAARKHIKAIKKREA